MLMALSAFQVTATSMSSDAHAMDVRNGKVVIGHNGVTCDLGGFLVSKATKDIAGSKKYSNNAQVVDTDTVAIIVKKLNHRFSDFNKIISTGLDAPGYYDQYPHKLPDYFASGSCTKGGR
jgi:hypothetical protein